MKSCFGSNNENSEEIAIRVSAEIPVPKGRKFGSQTVVGRHGVKQQAQPCHRKIQRTLSVGLVNLWLLRSTSRNISFEAKYHSNARFHAQCMICMVLRNGDNRPCFAPQFIFTTSQINYEFTNCLAIKNLYYIMLHSLLWYN